MLRGVPPVPASDIRSTGQSVSAVVDALRAAGLSVKPAGTLNQPFWGAPAQVFTVDGDDVQMYDFGSDPEAEKAAAQVSAEGGSIGGSSVAWIAPPHFFRKGNLIAIHLGASARTEAELVRLFGAQFAGRR